MTTLTIIAAVAAFLVFYGYIKSRPWGFFKKFGIGIAGFIAGAIALGMLGTSDISAPIGLVRVLWVAGIGLFVLFMVHEARPLNLRWLKNVKKENAQAYGFGALVAAVILAVTFDPAVGSRFWHVTERLTEESPEQVRSKEDALMASSCQFQVENEARFKTKVNFIGFPRTGRTGNIVSVHGNVELMNGMGLMIPHNYYCMFKDGKLVKMKVREG